MSWLIIVNFLFVILFLLLLWVPMKRALHMFQQNRYERERYSAWLINNVKTQYKQNYIPFVLLIAIIIAGFFMEIGIYRIVMALIIVLWFIYLIVKELNQEYIKPLVFTDRVKRQLAVMTILYLIMMIAMMQFRFEWESVMLFMCTYGVWFMVFVMDFITRPIEETVKKKFLNDAKHRLEGFNNMIKIGITGSYGKTSSKNILQAILSEKFYSLMTPASFNTPMGITRTIREHLKPIHEVFICEMGADHVGDIKELCDFVHPSIGLVTSIGPQHLNTFGSLENIIKEKMTMIESLPQDGVGIINKDNEYIRNYKINNTCKLISYGITQSDVDYHATNIVYSPKGSTFVVVSKDGEHEFETRLLGEHNIANICAAIAIARELKVEWKELQQAVKKVQYVEHRLELKKINGYTFIDNAFNSNPVGSAMSLEVMKMMPNRRFIITPGMIDLGVQQDEINKEFGRKMKDKVDEVILVGVQQTKPIVEGLQEVEFDSTHVHVCKTVKEAFALVYTLATPTDTILLENDLPDAFNN
ncbi:UDP-N-acetylmuramoyl-tripeptide--D-alanyl-D-alanine ligase [Anaerorhabdus sp.]|uniref:UDP-N-acetylmuramoyl-tripeptide--D-alanyl-D- alanine ligase n=1 Tax=Anaerorhabdus sp. TaxID=1872524 RepID=UPI002B1EA960|nr:UDP-N-acetylmuramoyl-tripeptide--D-alanyl-D-alanine ligase [Anaerorhabdus sp.]MEA4874570.1 UDP-N-acetylmuramoyl-tripeptide--D-alanyl-D-alanine ligase [Anaerorhabdus sp.]